MTFDCNGNVRLSSPPPGNKSDDAQYAIGHPAEEKGPVDGDDEDIDAPVASDGLTTDPAGHHVVGGLEKGDREGETRKQLDERWKAPFPN